MWNVNLRQKEVEMEDVNQTQFTDIRNVTAIFFAAIVFCSESLPPPMSLFFACGTSEASRLLCMAIDVASRATENHTFR